MTIKSIWANRAFSIGNTPDGTRPTGHEAQALERWPVTYIAVQGSRALRHTRTRATSWYNAVGRRRATHELFERIPISPTHVAALARSRASVRSLAALPDGGYL